MPRKPISTLPMTDIIERHNNGTSLRILAAEHGVSYSTMRRHFHQAGGETHYTPRGTVPTERIIHLRDVDKHSFVEIATIVGMSPSAVHARYLRATNHHTNHHGPHPASDTIRALYENDRLTVAAIAERLNLNKIAVYRALRHLGVTLRRGRPPRKNPTS